MIITNSILNGFLIKNRIKGKFLKNITRNKHILTKELEHCQSTIPMVFGWENTPEGGIYWAIHSINYRKYHQEHYKGGIK